MGFSSNIYLLLSAMGFAAGLDNRGTMLFLLYFICAPMVLIVGIIIAVIICYMVVRKVKQRRQTPKNNME